MGPFQSSGAHRQSYLPVLEGVRGMAVLLVVLSHMSSSDVFFDRSVSFRGLGNYGVYLFFVLSAFLLTRQFLERPPEPATSVRYWSAYAVRRVLRIYPLFMMALALTAIWPLASFAIAGPNPPSILRHLLLLEGQKILWTIPVEMKFYMLLPVVLVAMHLVTRSRPLPAMLFLLAFVSLASIVLPPETVPMLSIDLRDYLGLFVLGMVAAAAWQWLGRRRIPPVVAFACDAAAIVLLLAAVAPAALGVSLEPTRQLILAWLGSTVSWYGAVWSLFLLSVLSSRFVGRIFELRLLREIGVASFSAYLWHMVVIEFLRRQLPQTGTTAVVVLAAVIAISLIFYRLLERPGIALSSRWSGRRLEAAVK